MYPDREKAKQLLEEAVSICLTHSFHTGTVQGYIGNFDVPPERVRDGVPSFGAALRAYPQEKKEKIWELKAHFEELCGEGIYTGKRMKHYGTGYGIMDNSIHRAWKS